MQHIEIQAVKCCPGTADLEVFHIGMLTHAIFDNHLFLISNELRRNLAYEHLCIGILISLEALRNRLHQVSLRLGRKMVLGLPRLSGALM